jgi:hypothetical protein
MSVPAAGPIPPPAAPSGRPRRPVGKARARRTLRASTGVRSERAEPSVPARPVSSPRHRPGAPEPVAHDQRVGANDHRDRPSDGSGGSERAGAGPFSRFGQPSPAAQRSRSFDRLRQCQVVRSDQRFRPRSTHRSTGRFPVASTTVPARWPVATLHQTRSQRPRPSERTFIAVGAVRTRSVRGCERPSVRPSKRSFRRPIERGGRSAAPARARVDRSVRSLRPYVGFRSCVPHVTPIAQSVRGRAGRPGRCRAGRTDQAVATAAQFPAPAGR